MEGRDVVLPCDVAASASLSQATTVEWVRTDGPSPRTVHALRSSEELVKDQDPGYAGRTSILKDGSLELVAVRQQDTGTYKCVTRHVSGDSLEVTCNRNDFPSPRIFVSGVSC